MAKTPSKVEEKSQVEETNLELEVKDDGSVARPEPPKKAEPQYVTVDQLEKIQRGINYQNTSARKLEEKLEALLSTMPKPKVEEPKPLNEWDEKLNKDWKGTVEELAEQKFQALMERRQAQEAAQAQERRRMELFERSKRQVMEQHPDLADNFGEKSIMYQQIVSENPDYVSDPFGPVLAMHDMERRLRDMGKLDNHTQKLVKNEVNRQARAGAGATPTPGAPSNPSRITLTKDDLEFCKMNDIKPEVYASRKKQLESKQKGGA